MEETDNSRVLLKAKRRKTKSGSDISEKDNIKTLQDLDLNKSATNESAALEDEIQKIKDNEEMPSSFKNVVVNILKELHTERQKNEENSKHVAELQNKVSTLQNELDSSKQWQASVYLQLQRMTEFNNEMSKRVLELQNSQSKAVGKPSVTKSATKEQVAVVYGDSASAKKISQRRKLNILKHTGKEGSKKDEVKILELNPENLPSKENKKSETKTDEVQLQNPPENEKQVDHQETVPPKEEEKDEPSKIESIEETLREAAEAAVSQSGYAYDEASGMYYNWNTKMYYDPNSKLYYDHENGIYYYYDQERESYIFHSQVSVAVNDGADNKDDLKSTTENDGELSDGEIRSDGSSNDTEIDEVIVDPCVRVIVVKSVTVSIGTLFMVTCQGGSIGRDSTNTIRLSEEMVSRNHAKVIYEKESKTFFLQDLETQNGTFINDERISDPKTESEPVELTHRDYVQVGGTTLSFHIHIGNETCFDCEPGNIQAIAEENDSKVELKEDLNTQRKQGMKSMMKKYGLSKGYIPKKLIESIPDRAGRRRQEVGSEAYENTMKPVEKASIHKEISETNIGHKMLSKMGWKSGEGLGKAHQGIAQPIGVHVQGRNTGLGFGQKNNIENHSVKSSRKQDILNKTKERFEKVEKK